MVDLDDLLDVLNLSVFKAQKPKRESWYQRTIKSLKQYAKQVRVAKLQQSK